MKGKLLSITASISFFFCLLLANSAAAAGYTLTVSADGSGTVTRNPTNSIYPPGVTVTVTAIPDVGWHFDSWSGDASGTNNPLNVMMNTNLAITGHFLALPKFTLTLLTNGLGTIVLNPPGGSYVSNALVTATATPAAGWVFDSWSGDVSTTQNPLPLTLNSNLSLTGTFGQPPAFDVQPVSVTNAPGSTVAFSAHAVGSTPLAMQWYFSGGSLPGASNSTLTLTNVSPGQAGNYWVVATDRYGSATSSIVSLTLTNSTTATHVVNSPDDASLRAAIALGGWIGFGFSGTVTLTNTIPITTNVFLDGSGAGVTISGGNAVRLFSVAPGVTFGATNVTLANGTCLVTNNRAGVTADGGAVYNTGGNVTLVACTLTNNNALCTSFGGVARGGAIFNDGGTVSLFQTSASNNLAIAGGQFAAYPSNFINTAFGGAIYSTNGAVTITGCVISSNHCQALCQQSSLYGPSGYITMGGAAFQASGSMTIERSVFAANQALGGPGGGTFEGALTRPAHGGALAAAAGSVTISDSLLLGNTAQGGTGSYHSSGGFAYGGAIYSSASLALRDTALVGNQAAGAVCGAPNPSITPADGYGGAIYNSGTAVLNNCSAYSNSAIGGPGAVSAVYGAVTGGVGSGGAIFNAAQFGATNCTLALNSASGGVGQGYSYFLGTSGNAFGGGVFNSTNATFASMNLTIASNACSSAFGQYFTNGLVTGFQIANKSGTLRLHNSLIAYSGTNANAYGTITDDGYNICSDGSAQLYGGASYNFTDPKLGPLGGYGGPTLCMPLLAGSPAIDTGDPAQSPSTDQRGAIRPFGAGPDMGAYEFGAQALGYTLDVSADGSGIVTKDPAYSIYPQGATVTVTAVANDGAYFDHWSGDASGSTNPLDVTINTNLAITAHFLAFPYTITLQTNGQGTVALNPPWSTYPRGATVTVTATPNDGWYFDHWSGDTSGSTNPLNVTVNKSLAITAHFLAFPCGVTLRTNGEGTIVLNPAGGHYLSNSLVTVTATPAPGWAFDSWSGTISSTTNPLLVTVNSNLSLIGTFRQPLCVPPPSGLVGWWRGEGDSSDSSGTNNGVLQGGAGFTAGMAGQAFNLNGTSQYVDVPDSPNLNPTNSISVEAWIYPRQPLNDGGSIIVGKDGEDLATQDGYELFFDHNGSMIKFFVYLSGGRGWTRTALAPVSLNQWSHVVGVYDGSLLSLYTNGVLAGTPVSTSGQIVPSGNHLQIGNDPSRPFYFNGLIDEASVYNRALSASEIAAIYNAASAGKCTNQQARPYLSVILTPSNIVISFLASPSNLYCLQASTNMSTWTELCTNGPFTSPTSVTQPVSMQGISARCFRLRMQ